MFLMANLDGILICGVGDTDMILNQFILDVQLQLAKFWSVKITQLHLRMPRTSWIKTEFNSRRFLLD